MMVRTSPEEQVNVTDHEQNELEEEEKKQSDDADARDERRSSDQEDCGEEQADKSQDHEDEALVLGDEGQDHQDEGQELGENHDCLEDEDQDNEDEVHNHEDDDLDLGEDDEDHEEDSQDHLDKDLELGDEGQDGNVTRTTKVKVKSTDRKSVPGIIYMGHIPPRLRPKHVRNMLSVYGEIGRIFLQPEDQQVRARKKKSGLRRCDFTEGWVEFRDKRVAKRVAASLHNTPMATRKRQRIAADLWCMKYLHRFQWTHLSERLSYERSVLQQRLRTEVSQAKRETNFYLENVDKSAHLERKRRRDGPQAEEKSWDFTQRPTEEEIQTKKKRKKDSIAQKQLDKSQHIQQQSQSNVSLLAKIFNSTPVQ